MHKLPLSLIIIPVDPSLSEEVFDLGLQPNEPDYDAIKAWLQPHMERCFPSGNFEHVSVWLTPDRKPSKGIDRGLGIRSDLFVDERGSYNLAVNERATAIYQCATLSHRPDEIDLPYIYGNAILFSRRIWY